MFHKIKNVEALYNYILKIIFQDDTVKYYDVSKLFDKWIVFQDLKNINGLFEQVKVDQGGYGISWNDKLDLACNELWENGYIDYNEDEHYNTGEMMVAEESEEYKFE